jgi:hypothetical protein
MAGLVVTRILIDGTILTAALSAALVLMLHLNPRLALSDYPEDVKAAVPPRTRRELRLGVALTIPMLIVAVGIPLYSAWLVRAQSGGDLTYGVRIIPAVHAVQHLRPDRLDVGMFYL